MFKFKNILSAIGPGLGSGWTTKTVRAVCTGSLLMPKDEAINS